MSLNEQMLLPILLLQFYNQKLKENELIYYFRSVENNLKVNNKINADITLLNNKINFSKCSQLIE